MRNMALPCHSAHPWRHSLILRSVVFRVNIPLSPNAVGAGILTQDAWTTLVRCSQLAFHAAFNSRAKTLQAAVGVIEKRRRCVYEVLSQSKACFVECVFSESISRGTECLSAVRTAVCHLRQLTSDRNQLSLTMRQSLRNRHDGSARSSQQEARVWKVVKIRYRHTLHRRNHVDLLQNGNLLYTWSVSKCPSLAHAIHTTC